MDPDVRNEATNEIKHQYLTAAKARRVLGWSPLFNLEEGLTRTIRRVPGIFSEVNNGPC